MRNSNLELARHLRQLRRGTGSLCAGPLRHDALSPRRGLFELKPTGKSLAPLADAAHTFLGAASPRAHQPLGRGLAHDQRHELVPPRLEDLGPAAGWPSTCCASTTTASTTPTAPPPPPLRGSSSPILEASRPGPKSGSTVMAQRDLPSVTVGVAGALGQGVS